MLVGLSPMVSLTAVTPASPAGNKSTENTNFRYTRKIIIVLPISYCKDKNNSMGMVSDTCGTGLPLTESIYLCVLTTNLTSGCFDECTNILLKFCILCMQCPILKKTKMCIHTY